VLRLWNNLKIILKIDIMKKFKAGEGEDIMFFKGHRTRLNQHLSTLQPGDRLIIERDIDWKGKRDPYYIINRLAKKNGWKFESGKTLDGKGWGVKRIS
jgi:hypothetical protein